MIVLQSVSGDMIPQCALAADGYHLLNHKKAFILSPNHGTIQMEFNHLEVKSIVLSGTYCLDGGTSGL
jgi:hypothetical protein